MSDNEHTLPILGDSKVFAVKHLPFSVIPQFIQGSDNGLECIPPIVIEESFDILEE